VAADDQGVGNPKTAEVVALLRLFPEEIEADLLSRQIDIADWWRGEMTSRRLWVLIEHLPETSATAQARRGDRWPEWTHILALVTDQLTFLRAEVQAGLGAKTPMKPKPLPRPRDEEERAEQQGAARNVRDYLLRNQERPPGQR